jgi:hypothetical protein
MHERTHVRGHEVDVRALQRGDLLAELPVGGGNPFDMTGNLLDVLNHIAPALAIEMLAEQVHMIRAVSEHSPAPIVAQVPGADGLDREIHLAHFLFDPIMLEIILVQIA